jgi:hypothetical protein
MLQYHKGIRAVPPTLSSSCQTWSPDQEGWLLVILTQPNLYVLQSEYVCQIYVHICSTVRLPDLSFSRKMSIRYEHISSAVELLNLSFKYTYCLAGVCLICPPVRRCLSDILVHILSTVRPLNLSSSQKMPLKIHISALQSDCWILFLLPDSCVFSFVRQNISSFDRQPNLLAVLLDCCTYLFQSQTTKNIMAN